MLHTLTWLLRLAAVLPTLALGVLIATLGWQVIHDCFGEQAQPVAQASAYLQPVKWEWVGRRVRAACIGLHLALLGPAVVSWELAIEAAFLAEYPMPVVLAVPMLIVMAVITLVVLRLLGSYRRRVFDRMRVPPGLVT